MNEVKRFYATDDFSGEEVVYAADYDAIVNEWRVAVGDNIMLRKELANTRSECDALRSEVERLRFLLLGDNKYEESRRRSNH